MGTDLAKVERLAEAITEVLVEELGEGEPAAGEVVSALFTVLARILTGIQNMEDPEARIYNAAQINRSLVELMIHTGKPH